MKMYIINGQVLQLKKYLNHQMKIMKKKKMKF